MVNLVVYTGGAQGADTYFTQKFLSQKKDIQVITYSFAGHYIPKENHSSTVIALTQAQLDVFKDDMKSISKLLNRKQTKNIYIQNLLLRNAYQVKDSEAVYAIGKIKEDSSSSSLGIEGGTAYACELFVKRNMRSCSVLHLYFFDQSKEKWFQPSFHEESGSTYVVWKELENVPPFSSFSRITAIGTRELQECGKKAIDSLFFE